MPGFDSSGPLGAGPMTGGGRGRCNPATRRSLLPLTGGYRRGSGLGHGFRCGFGRQQGRGFHDVRWYPSDATAAEKATPVEPADEIEMLKAEADDLHKSLEAIKQRIQSLQEKSGTHT